MIKAIFLVNYIEGQPDLNQDWYPWDSAALEEVSDPNQQQVRMLIGNTSQEAIDEMKNTPERWTFIEDYVEEIL
jgi:hypothetical protein